MRQVAGGAAVLWTARALFLFGSPIAKSASPAMHKAAFRALGLAPGWDYAPPGPAAAAAMRPP
jgi:shikimate 5-dehydrogenase